MNKTSDKKYNCIVQLIFMKKIMLPACAGSIAKTYLELAK